MCDHQNSQIWLTKEEAHVRLRELARICRPDCEAIVVVEKRDGLYRLRFQDSYGLDDAQSLINVLSRPSSARLTGPSNQSRSGAKSEPAAPAPGPLDNQRTRTHGSSTTADHAGSSQNMNSADAERDAESAHSTGTEPKYRDHVPEDIPTLEHRLFWGTLAMENQELEKHVGDFIDMLDRLKIHIPRWTQRDPDVGELMAVLETTIDEFQTARSKFVVANDQVAAEKVAVERLKREAEQELKKAQSDRVNLQKAQAQLTQVVKAINDPNRPANADVNQITEAVKQLRIPEAINSLKVEDLAPIRNQLQAMHEESIGHIKDDVNKIKEVIVAIGDVVLAPDDRGPQPAATDPGKETLPQLVQSNLTLSGELQTRTKESAAHKQKADQLRNEFRCFKNNIEGLEEKRSVIEQRVTSMRDKVAARLVGYTQRLDRTEDMAASLSAQLKHARAESRYFRRLVDARDTVARTKLCEQHEMLLLFDPTQVLDLNLDPDPHVEAPSSSLTPWKTIVFEQSQLLSSFDVSMVAEPPGLDSMVPILWATIFHKGALNGLEGLLEREADGQWYCSKLLEHLADDQDWSRAVCDHNRCFQVRRDASKKRSLIAKLRDRDTSPS
ncbi:hypothetical protein F4780DRAFT_766367 [Xylariomycetidae sp. FL0641]|nr:hypothetical protein F4780DRAFT_766367 [Xylariomycetidae sp. FL0641]